jgi:hypothetical protein
MIVSLLSFGTVVLAREGADTTRDTIQRALRAAQARQQRIKRDVDDQERCGCNKPKPKAEESNADNQQDRCGCSKPKPKNQERCESCQEEMIKQSVADALAEALAAAGQLQQESNADNQQDRCGCSKPKPKNQERCTPCQQAAIRQSIADVLADALAEAEAIAKRMELDTTDLRNWARAPRESLDDPTSSCENPPVAEVGCPPEESCCDVATQIICLLQCQGREARKCCRKIKHELEDIEELVESHLDQSIECCSIIETTLGDPGNSALDIPDCSQVLSIMDVIDGTNVDVITWLKSIYLLLFQVYQCACQPCLT